MEKSYIKTKLQELLDNFADYFEEGELAYYSSQCKNEQQIRDKIAWKLQKDIQKYGDKYVVRREWLPKRDKADKSRVDLAILEIKPKTEEEEERVERVIALIEFKAQSIARPEAWYLAEFVRDVTKMRDIKQAKNTKCENADLYYVFLETGQDKNADKYKSVLGYSLYQGDKCVYYEKGKEKAYLDAVKLHWDKFNQGDYKVKDLDPKSISIPYPEAKSIGEAFGYTQYVSPLLLGPLEFLK